MPYFVVVFYSSGYNFDDADVGNERILIDGWIT
jgi:hypothetical protein